MIRLSFRTFVLCVALGLVALMYQFQNIQNESKSRRNRISMSDDPPVEESISEEEEVSVAYDLNEAVHAFYYPWYASEEVDGQWAHWNHPVLPHWIARVNAQCKGCKSKRKIEFLCLLKYLKFSRKVW